MNIPQHCKQINIMALARGWPQQLAGLLTQPAPKIIKTSVALFAVLLAPALAQAAAPIDPVSGFSYIDNGTEIEIAGCPTGCTNKSIVIPSSVIGKPVTAVSGFANEALTSVILAPSLTYIAGSTFEDNLLTEIVIPDKVIHIENYAFRNNRLTSVKLGERVENIRYFTFADNLLTTMTFPSNTPYLDNLSFSNNLLESLTFLGDAPSTNSDVFQDNPNLKTVTHPANNATWLGLTTLSGAPAGLNFKSTAVAARPVPVWSHTGFLLCCLGLLTLASRRQKAK